MTKENKTITLAAVIGTLLLVVYPISLIIENRRLNPRPSQATSLETYALMESIHSNKPDAFRKAMESGADVKARVWGKGNSVSTGDTPLTTAAEHNNEYMATLLMDHGAPVNTTDHLGRTPFQLAACNGNKKLMELLISRGADVRAVGPHHRTALHDLAECRWTMPQSIFKESVELLIDNGADVNARDEDGSTALHLCIVNNNMGAAEALVSRGADVNARGKFGIRPLDIAVSRKAADFVKFLSSKGAKSGGVTMQLRVGLRRLLPGGKYAGVY
jgi:ankyrin repeat protein